MSESGREMTRDELVTRLIELNKDKNELLAAIIGYRTGQLSDRAFDVLIEKHRRA